MLLPAQITLTDEHRNKAIEEYITTSIVNCCPVFQAIKAAGYPILSVGAETVTFTDYSYALLDEPAWQVTMMDARLWSQLELPITFTLTEVT